MMENWTWIVLAIRAGLIQTVHSAGLHSMVVTANISVMVMLESAVLPKNMAPVPVFFQSIYNLLLFYA